MSKNGKTVPKLKKYKMFHTGINCFNLLRKLGFDSFYLYILVFCFKYPVPSGQRTHAEPISLSLFFVVEFKNALEWVEWPDSSSLEITRMDNILGIISSLNVIFDNLYMVL